MKKQIITSLIILLVSVFSGVSFAQSPANWQNLDLKTDSVFGISTEIAYDELLKGKVSKTVVVAVIDAGIDTNHEDLRPVLWRNPKEKSNNKDDDHNGYTDDIFGWNFIGSAKGNVKQDNAELTRQVRQGYTRFVGKSISSLSNEEAAEYKEWKKEKSLLDSQINVSARIDFNISQFKLDLDSMFSIMGTKTPSLEQLDAYKPRNQKEEEEKVYLIHTLKSYPDLNSFITGALAHDLERAEDDLKYHLNINYDSREIVGDDYFNSNQRFYGNNNVYGPSASHGTHVAGIIGAVRDNNIGIKGVADNVRIMMILVVPEGDERDKDVANAIRYAVDNGAQIINMSFGKSYSQDKKIVDEAVKYAMAHDVLIVHAAGNGNENLDSIKSYPNPKYEDGSGVAGAWLEVGASGPYWNRNLKASFSNYGKNSVDVFAPGVQILSTVPESKYEKYDGTSMAAPVVTGLAALLREYYPKLTAFQVKDIIVRSTISFPHHVFVIKNNTEVAIEFSELSKSGGIVNAYNALKLAAIYSAENK